MHCEHCGRETPPGHYCAYCGADLTQQAAHAAQRRRHNYAANPHESVYHPGIVSTYFPHLNPHRTQQVRWVLFGGIAIIFLIGLGRYVPIATVAAALFIPMLYLAYYFDVALYENEPLRVLAGTFLVGGVMGTAMSIGFFSVLRRLYRPGFGPSPTYLWVHGVGLPLLAQVLMLVGPLLLFFIRPRFRDVLDGLSFGVASGLGFAAASSIVYQWLLITGRFQQTGSAASWALPTILNSLIVPLLDAGTTGLICAALWYAREGRSAARRTDPLTSLPVAVLIAALGQVVPALGNDLRGGLVQAIFWYGGVLIVIMLCVRHVLHEALVERAGELGHGASIRCPHCGHLIPDVAFCPHCGIALRSTSKRERRVQPAEAPHA
jgi:RsiW-degrading membrane proteinase PrsW (M82 family)